MATISVVTPAYNAREYLAETIESVLAQSIPDWELIVVDDGSTDSTAEVAREYAASDPRVRLVQQENRGLAGARNRGYAEASGDSRYLLFLDADDLLEPDALKTLIDAHSHEPAAMAVFGQAKFIDAEGQPLATSQLAEIVRSRWTFLHGKPVVVPWSSLDDAPPTYQSLLYGNCIRTPGLVLIPRQSLGQADLFDPVAHGVEDWDLWLRLSLRGDIGYTEQVVLRYRIHAQNMSSRLDFMRLGELNMRKKLLESPGLTQEQRRQAEEALRFHYFGRDRLPTVVAARRMLDRACGAATDASAPASAVSTPLENMRRDLLVLVALDCDAKLAEQVRSSCAGETLSFGPAESAALAAAQERLVREENRLMVPEKLRALSLRWPFLPFRKAFRLLRHIYLASVERLRPSKAGEER